MKFMDWWEDKGRQDFTARVKDCGPQYHDLQPSTISIEDAEWIAKHCAWQSWLNGMVAQLKDMSKVE